MISWPAAKQIRWVNPSIATVSPSRTRSATASRIVVCLELIGRPAVVRPAQDAELVALRVAHLGPGPVTLVDEPDLVCAELAHPLDLRRHGGRRAEIQMHAVLDDLRLRDGLEEESSRASRRIEHERAAGVR